MAPTPFEHGLALAWSDGALSRDGAIMLEKLQSKLELSDSERAIQEEAWLALLSVNERRSFGDGDAILNEWLAALDDTTSLSETVRSMGRATLDLGLSKTTWNEAMAFAGGLGLSTPLAEGVWMEGATEELTEWPPALDPLAVILGLVISVGSIQGTDDIEYGDGTKIVNITHPEATAATLSWMPELLPLAGESCSWGWKENSELSSEMPQGGLVFNNSVILAWIRRFVSMRLSRGEPGLDGLPEGVTLMPSSSSLEGDSNSMTISMIVDLGEAGLVKPWAKVSVDEVPEIISAPDGLAENWIRIHDALAKLLINALETLPRQLLLASGLQIEYANLNQDGDWMIYDLVG